MKNNKVGQLYIKVEMNIKYYIFPCYYYWLNWISSIELLDTFNKFKIRNILLKRMFPFFHLNPREKKITKISSKEFFDWEISSKEWVKFSLYTKLKFRLLSFLVPNFKIYIIKYNHI